jgi:TolA-binding protein
MENDYSQALKEYALTGTDEPLWELAQKAEDEGLYDAALNSYENLASGKGKYSSAAAYRIGVVLAAETKYEKSIEAFNKFIRDFPADSNVPSAKYGVGTVYAEGLSDPAAALPYFSELASRGRPEGIGLDSKVMVADCDVRLGNLRQAALDIEPVLQSDESGRSLFLLAEILYFQGDFDSALVVYNKIPDQMPNSDYANDALSRSLLLSAHANAKKELQRMANAERMMYAREYDSAIKESRSLMAAEPASDLADDCVLLIGEALEGKKSYNEAVAAYRDLIKVYPESRLKPEAQRRIGELFADRLNDKKAAIEELEQLLVNYPDYVLAGAVRNRIEELKGGEHQ